MNRVSRTMLALMGRLFVRDPTLMDRGSIPLAGESPKRYDPADDRPMRAVPAHVVHIPSHLADKSTMEINEGELGMTSDSGDAFVRHGDGKPEAQAHLTWPSVVGGDATKYDGQTPSPRPSTTTPT